MNFIAIALAICVYGSQSIFESRLIPMSILLICLITLALRKQYLGAFLCLCTLSILGLSEIATMERLWPLPSVLVSVAGALFLVKTGRVQWFGTSRIQIKPLTLAIAGGVISFLGVALWVYYTGPSIEQIPFKIPSSLNIFWIPILILLFAASNSFSEEFIFRGLALEGLGQKSVLAGVVIQALGFALLHFKGFPYGVSGALLAGVFALLMGALRVRTGSLIYPWIAHFTANVAMGILLYNMALS